MISISFVANRHALLAPALQMARQINFNCQCWIDSNQLFVSLPDDIPGFGCSFCTSHVIAVLGMI